jgi:ATP-dependent Clp protease adaptor protein ClpS
MADYVPAPGGQVLDELDEELETPRLWRVLLHNDNYTTMDFVVEILVEVFRKPQPVAATIMLHVHERGVGECGIFPRDIAETKVRQVDARAQRAGFPLRCTMEPE